MLNVSLEESKDWLCNERSKYNPLASREYWILDNAMYAIDTEIPYTLDRQDGDTGICKCGAVTEIIDCPFYCKYCGQKLCK